MVSPARDLSTIGTKSDLGTYFEHARVLICQESATDIRGVRTVHQRRVGGQRYWRSECKAPGIKIGNVRMEGINSNSVSTLIYRGSSLIWRQVEVETLRLKRQVEDLHAFEPTLGLRDAIWVDNEPRMGSRESAPKIPVMNVIKVRAEETGDIDISARIYSGCRPKSMLVLNICRIKQWSETWRSAKGIISKEPIMTARKIESEGMGDPDTSTRICPGWGPRSMLNLKVYPRVGEQWSWGTNGVENEASYANEVSIDAVEG
ncbi:hypothetical protein DFH09DRAFT_1093140 [Mycena vulgaris]|nr:hypothetical protein DFH09DRAFT_1093140 [Mycena vulgaris]